MEFVKKETIYHYKMNETENIALVGILSILDERGEIKIVDDSSKKLIKNLLQGLIK